MRLRRIALIAALLPAFGAPADFAHAAWPNVPGVNVRLANTGNNQDGPMMAADAEGGAFYVWNEAGNIRAQRLTALGLVAPGWPATGVVVTAAAGSQFLTAVVADGFGGFIACWDDYRNGDIDPYAQRIAADGSALWVANGAPVNITPGDQHSARVCADRTGGAVLVWNDLRAFGTNGIDLFAQRLSSTGSLVWSGGGVPVAELFQEQSSPSVISDGTPGGAIFLWRDLRSAGDPNLYAQRLDASGNVRPGWTPNGTAVCLAAGDQYQPVLASDGAFGLFAAWNDARGGAQGIYVKRMTPSGATASGWPANGLALTSTPFFQDNPQVIADGAGGAIVTWTDTFAPDWDVFAQRVGPTGVVAWLAGGVQLEFALGDQYSARPVSDGSGGAVVAFTDTRAGQPPALYVQRITAAGAIAPGWSADGQHITDHWVQFPSIVSDGMGGAFLGWQRADPSPQAAFAQHVDPWGYLGAQADIAGVADVPNDQGGRVKLSWDRSPLDVFPGGSIASYLVCRSVPPQAARAALARGEARLAGTASNEGARRVFVASQLAGATIYWEQLATVPALHLAGYSTLAATARDSVAGSNPRTLFMVRAQNADASRFWDSDPDSGYSVDNLPPSAPAPFTGSYAAGGTQLHWGVNGEPDLALYRLYRGTDASFAPAPGNRVAEQPDTGYVDIGPAGRWYKLTAVDAHGNESVVSVLAPSGTVGVGEPGEAQVLSLAAPFPNPASSGTSCRFSLPAGGRTQVAVFDAAGRLVRALLDAELEAGAHVARWDGRDAGGSRVGAGLYFVRLTHGDRRLGTRLVVLD